MGVTLSKQSSPVQRKPLYKSIWAIHRWLGLAFGVIIVVVSLSGGLMVMNDELERFFERDRRVIQPPSNPADRAPIVDVVRRASLEAPQGYRPLRLEPGVAADKSDKLVFISSNRVDRWSVFVNGYTGEFLWRGPDQALIRPWLLHLHEKLHLGHIGYLVVGLSAVALTVSSLTGFWMVRKRIPALIKRPCRARLGWRIAMSDLHQWLGIVTLYFGLVLGITGVWFAILIVPGVFQAEERATLPPAFDLNRLTEIEPALAVAQKHFPGAELARIIFPWDDGVPLQVRVLHRDAPIWEKMSRIDFDPITGKMRRVVDARKATAGQKFNSILGPLHFGYYGSSLVKWLYVIGGFAPAILSITGCIIWWKRSRRVRVT